MILRVEALPPDETDSSWRANLPTYRMRDISYEHGICIVEIPDIDAPDIPEGITPPSTLSAADLSPSTRIPAASVTEWYEALDSRYPQRAGEFRSALR